LKKASIFAIREAVGSKTDTEPPAAVNFMTGAVHILRQEIGQQGVIPFTRFMELALYCPEYGYYEQTESTIGRGGDFYTNVSVGPLFGELLAHQWSEWLNALPAGTPRLIESGAHDGQLALDILTWLRERRPGLAAQLEYWIVEPSASHQGQQRAKLEEFAGQTRWCDTLSALPASLTGILFSNELLDAMPVRRLGWDAHTKTWFEWGVGLQGEQFRWEKICGNGKELQSELECAGLPLTPELLAALPDEFTVDHSAAAADWWGQATRVMRSGKIVAIDYGLNAEEMLMPERSQGTLRAYRRHHAQCDVLVKPGEQDLTAHVNFTPLQRIGDAAGWRTEGLLTQTKFLTQIAQQTWNNAVDFGEWTPARLRQFQTLTHPEHLGHSFKVLVQAR
jgi:SAM-dependent MidA family methyltransferase